MERNWDNIITDPKTGLPELPSNMFWRVQKSGQTYYEVRLIQIKTKKVCFFWEKKVDRQSSHYGVGKPLTKSNVRSWAETAYRDWRSWVESVGETDLLGDYPPKSL